MFKYFKPFIPKASIAALFKMTEAFCDLSLPLIMAKIIDIGVANQNMNYIIKMGLTMVGIALGGYLSSILCNYFSVHATQNFGASLRDNVFTKIQNFNFVHLNKYTQASLITRITKDVDQITNMFLMCVRMVLRGLVTGIGAVFMAVTINPVLSILFLVIVPSIVGSTLYYMKKSFGKYSEVQKKLDSLTLVLRENLTGIRVIRALSKESVEKEKFRLRNDDLKNKTIEADNLMSSKLPFITLIMNLGVVAVLWFGGIRVSYGKMHLGEVVAFINYLNMLLFSMNALSFLFTLYSRTAISYKRVKEILSENIENISQEEFEKLVTDDIIEFKNLSFSYDGTDKYILENINLKIKRGENIAVVGESGAGKSTICSLIPRFYDVTNGEVFIDSINVKDIQERTLRENIGIVQQDTFLFNGTIAENIMFGKLNADMEEVVEAAKKANAYEFIMEMPDGFNSVIGERGIKLSGGQKQRISIARIFLKNPKILILDEATSALDNNTEKQIQKSLEELSKGRTSVTIAHRLTTVNKCDRIIVLGKDGILEEGNHETLMNKKGVYYNFYMSQQRENI